MNPARWRWLNPEEVVRIYPKHRSRPSLWTISSAVALAKEEGQIPKNRNLASSQELINRPGIAAKQIEEPRKLR